MGGDKGGGRAREEEGGRLLYLASALKGMRCGEIFLDLLNMWACVRGDQNSYLYYSMSVHLSGKKDDLR